MGFVKTNEELNRYYAQRVRVFPKARMMGVMFGADAAVTRALLPPPLEQAAVPGGLIFIAEYGDTNLGPGYREAALFLRCRYQGVAGNYCLAMPIDSQASRMHNGRDIYGFPKKTARIHFEESGGHAHGWVERNGVRFIELDIDLTGELPDLPPSGPTYLFKAMPRADLQPGFDGPVLLVGQRTEVSPRRIQIGPADLRMQPSGDDPWSELADLRVSLAFCIESSNTMLPGEVLAEVDAEAYLPHYFRMTDLFSEQAAPPPPETEPAVSHRRATTAIGFDRNATQQQLVELVRDFGREVLQPAEVALDRIPDPNEAFASELYWATMAAAFELGLHKMTLPEAFGGLGLDPPTTGMIWEELGRYGVGFAASLMAGAVVPSLIAFVAPDNKAMVDRFIVPFCADRSGRRITAWGSSEANVGSDGKNYDDLSVHHSARATRVEGGWRLGGSKSAFVSNGGVADAYVVFASVDPDKGLRGSGAFVIPADAAGVGHGPAEDRVGLRALNQAAVVMDNAVVPADHLLFPPGDGYPMLHQAIMTVGNLGTGYLALGLMRAAFEEATAYAHERVQWGKPIIEHQLVARRLFDAHAAIESTRALLQKGSWHSARGFPGDLATSLTGKVLATNHAVQQTAAMVQVLGGYGISRDYKLEKYMRDASLLTIMDGTNDTLLLKVAGRF